MALRVGLCNHIQLVKILLQEEKTPPTYAPTASPMSCRLPTKQMHWSKLGNTPKNEHKASRSLSLLPQNINILVHAGGAFAPGRLFPHNPSEDHAALMLSSPGGAYFLAELISCGEEITGQCFPRTCGNSRGTVSQQQGYLSGETEARRRVNVPVTPSGCETQPGSRGLKIPPGFAQELLSGRDWR